MEAFSTASHQVIVHSSAIRPPIPPEKVFANEGIGSEGGQDAPLEDLFADDNDEQASPSREPGVEEVTLSDEDGEELEIETKCKVLPAPHNPTASQREDHSAGGHLPYRTWCDECVGARATGEQHRKRNERRTVSVLAFDYLHLDKSGVVLPRESLGDGGDVDLTILVAKDLLGKAVFAHVVPQKGVDKDNFSVDMLVEDVKWLGYQKIGLRSDNEPAILKLLRHALTEMRVAIHDLEQIFEEHPNTYDSSGNGEIESAVKQVTGVLRTNKLDLERRIEMVIPQSHPVISWLVGYAAWMITVRVVGHDGHTAYERIRHKRFAKRLVPFGETVQVYLPAKGPERLERGALDARTKIGVVLGYGTQSHSYVVFSEGEVDFYRSIYRRSLSNRWSAEKLQEVNVTRKDQHAPREARTVPFTAREATPGYEITGRAPKRFDIRQGDVDPAMGGSGWTEHCPKCMRSSRFGWKQSIVFQHSAACRSRIEAQLATTEKGRARLALTAQRKARWEHNRGADIAEAVRQVPGEGEMMAPATAAPTTPIPSADAPPQIAVEDKSDSDEDCEAMDWDRQPMTPDNYMTPDWEVMDWDRQPTTPDNYAPTSPGDSDRGQDVAMHVKDMELKRQCGDDVEPVMKLCGAAEMLCVELTKINGDILKTIDELGGSVNCYQNGRRGTILNLVAEIYSRPRVTSAVKLLPELSLLPGFALDLTTTNAQGENWDFSREEMRAQARALVTREKPLLLIGSPPCTPFCTWQDLNAARHGWSPAEVRRRRAAGELHIRFCCELYEEQHRQGRLFLHEQPSNASSWHLSCIRELMAKPGIARTVGDQCQYGQTAADGRPVKKATGWLSNAPAILEELSLRCTGREGRCSGGRKTHAAASGRVAREAAVYPFRLCRAILVGLRKHLIQQGKIAPGIHGCQTRFEEQDPAVSARGWVNACVTREVVYRDAITGELLPPELLDATRRLFSDDDPTDEINAVTKQETTYKDAVTGQPLQKALVEAARKLELEYFASKQVWAKRPYSEAMARTGKKPISVRWLDTNKGDDEECNYRSRLVAREIRKHGENPIFAPTPPLESLRTIVSLAATSIPGECEHVRDPHSEHRTQISFIDISRAYFCAETDPNDPTYVELPKEDPDHGRMVGLLLKHMYGTRKAADGWHCEYAGRLTQELGFEAGDASACVFYHRQRGLRCSVHGDDLTTVGSKTNLDWFKTELSKLYELKEPHRLGPGPKDDKEAVVLNRLVRWTASGLEYEADPRQAEKLLRDLRLDGEGVKAAATPGVKLTREQLDGDKGLERGKVSPYRAVAARGNYLSSDRPELQFAAKETCRWMADPMESSLNALKRLGRFVAGHRRLVYRYPWQTVTRIDTYSDTDWAGCPRTRKSTSGGCVILGSHLLKSWSSTQTFVSLSSGESEFYGVVKAGGVSLGYQALLRDLGIHLDARVWTDSSATMGICGRQGLGRLRHIDTQCLWIQQRVRDGSLELFKVKGEDNPADLFTKHLSSQERIHRLLELFNCHYAAGRAELAPKLRQDAGTSKGEGLCNLVADGDAIIWEGRAFPKTSADGEELPEAYSCCNASGAQERLPHQFSDLEDRFPKAKACCGPGDEDLAADDPVEKRGVTIGKTVAADGHGKRRLSA